MLTAPPLSINEETKVEFTVEPSVGTPGSSFIAASTGDFALSKTGVSLTAVILKVTDAALDDTVPSLVVNEIVPALVPLRFAVGVNVAASNAVFIAANVPDAEKLAEPLLPEGKVMPVVPNVTVPPVIVNVTVCASPSTSET